MECLLFFLKKFTPMTEPRKVIFEEENTAETSRAEIETNWEEYGLKPKLVKGLYSIGFDKPSYIQKKAVPHIAKGSNIRAQAQSGTGKTGAFCVGALERLNENEKATQCLVLVSTREIAKQIKNTFDSLSGYMGVKTQLLVGGNSREEDIAALEQDTPHIIVGTPGRVFDMLDSKNASTEKINMLILDEADELCKGEFLEQIKSIYMFLKVDDLQVMFFSATYGQEELKIIAQIAEDPVTIDLRTDEYTLQGIKQYCINIGAPFDKKFGSKFSVEKKKLELCLKVQTLINVLRSQPLGQTMIFTKRKNDAQDVFNLLQKEDFQCSLISSQLLQNERNEVINEFKSGKKRILVTSDICKRGIDVQGLSVVICLDVPHYDQKEDFIHRVGRSGRYGRRGIALHILTQHEYETIQKIAEDYRTTLEPMPKSFSFTE